MKNRSDSNGATPNQKSALGTDDDLGSRTENRRPLHYAEARRLLVTSILREPELHYFLLSWTLTITPVVAVVALCAVAPGFWSYCLAATVTGFAQNALGLLMHEGCHFFFHPSRKVNDRLTDVLVCLPIFNTVAGYRGLHFEHHRHAGTDRDPYAYLYRGYRGRAHLAASLLSDMLLVGAIVKFSRRYVIPDGEADAPQGGSFVLALAVVQAFLFALYWLATGWWAAWFVLWMLPLVTLAQVVNRVRTISEHAGEAEVETNRTTDPGWLEYLLVAPYGYAYHFEHHLAPTIPYFRLREAHRMLGEQGTPFADPELTGGYLRSFWRLAKTIGERP